MHHHDIIKFNVGWGIHDHCLKMRGHQRPAPGVRITRAVIAGMLLAFVACVATSQYLAKGIANRAVVLSGNIGSDSEYENEHDVSAAIHMGFQSNHTEQFTYVNEFNETLGSISANIEEAQGAVGEAKDLDSTYKRYYQGTDPW